MLKPLSSATSQPGLAVTLAWRLGSKVLWSFGIHKTVMNQIEVIASWNFRHIASVWARSRIEAALQELGYGACHIATPDELTEGELQ